MDVRDAVEEDADRLAELTDAPTDVMRNLVHDRTVRVGTEGDDVIGFVSFDAEERTIHVTQIEGPHEAQVRLLDEPVRFAGGEGMAVELLVPEDDEVSAAAATTVGFVEDGTGPRFGGTRTVRYRLDPYEN
jgi:hypothetical protein